MNGYPLEIFSPVPMTFDFLYRHYFNFILRDLFRIFIFENVPDTINETFLKYTLYLYGKITFFRDDDGTLLALNGAPSGQPDVYYIPEDMIVSNPRLTKSYNLKRDDDCVVVYCSDIDRYNQIDKYGGLYTIIVKTATMLADGDLSISVAQKNKRLINILAAEDQNTKNSIDIVIKKQYEGEPYAVVMKSLIDNVQSVPIIEKGTNQDLMQLIEAQQYILSHFYESLGLQTHDQMKRERLITAEVNDNDSVAKLNIDNILASIKSGLQEVNNKFGTEITVKLNPILEEEPEPEEKSSGEEPEPEKEEESSGEEPEPEKEEESSGEEPEPEKEEESSEEEPEPEKEEESSEEESEPEKEEESSGEEPEPEKEEESSGEEPEEEKTEVEINITLNDESTAEIEVNAGGDDDDTSMA